MLVTGGSRGIGQAICLVFAQAHWHVAVHCRERAGEAEQTAALVRAAGGQATVCRADIRDADAVDAMIATVVSRWDRLDVLVCNAGLASGGLLLRLSADDWTRTIETNLTGTFHCVRAAGRRMVEQQDGTIIVVGSYAGSQGRTGQAAYAASKAGLLGLVRSAAKEWGPHNVRVNMVFPGWQATELSQHARPSPNDLRDHALGRFADLGEVARMVYHLACLKDVSGQVWNLDSRIF